MRYFFKGCDKVRWKFILLPCFIFVVFFVIGIEAKIPDLFDTYIKLDWELIENREGEILDLIFSPLNTSETRIEVGLNLGGIIISKYDINNKNQTEKITQFIKAVHKRKAKVLVEYNIDFEVVYMNNNSLINTALNHDYYIWDNYFNYLLDRTSTLIDNGIDGFYFIGLNLFTDQGKNKLWWERFINRVEEKKDLIFIGSYQNSPAIGGSYFKAGFELMVNPGLETAIEETLTRKDSNILTESIDSLYHLYDQEIPSGYTDMPVIMTGDKDNLELAAAIQMTLPGIPFIKQDAVFGSFDEVVNSNENLRFYGELINLRKEYPILSSGGIIFQKINKEVISYLRYYDENNQVSIYHNIGDDDFLLEITKKQDLKVIYLTSSNQSPYILDGKVIFSLSPGSSFIYKFLE